MDLLSPRHGYYYKINMGNILQLRWKQSTKLYGPAGDNDIPNSSIDIRDIIVLKEFRNRVKLTAHYPLFSELNIILHLIKVGKNKNIKNI